MRNYEFYFVALAEVIIIFAVGFVVGKYGVKSSATLEQAENYKQHTQSTVESTTKNIIEENVTNEPKKSDRIITVTATAYCPCEKCCGKSDGITATGIKATAGRTIAIDPSVIPYGSEIEIDGHTYIAEDCGGCVKGNKIDIFFDTHKEALDFGKRQLTIIVNEGD